jgi:hypothetical protein
MKTTHISNLKRPEAGDPLSLLLFNLVADVFTKMLMKAARNGYLSGLMTSLHPEGVISLQYVDDTLLFLSHDYTKACHLKWLLVYFEELSRMKINYHKSDMILINLEEEEAQVYAKKTAVRLELSLSSTSGSLFTMRS